MPVAVTGCGGPASRVLRHCRRHYGASCGECADLGGHGPPLLASRGRALPGGGVGLGRVHARAPARSCSRPAAPRCPPPLHPRVTCLAAFILAPLCPRLLLAHRTGRSPPLCLCCSFLRVGLGGLGECCEVWALLSGPRRRRRRDADLSFPFPVWHS